MTQQEFQERYVYDPNSDCLGRGGFGAVYRAHDTLRGRDVALKISEVSNERFRLKHEVEIAKSLPEHRNIAHYEECYTLTNFSGVFDIAIMQFYEAGSLEHLLAHETLTMEQRADILRQILAGIAFLHSHDIIHRDLKPQNILVDKYRDKITVKITDFGISKHLSSGENSFVSNSIMGAGTLSYASPEQLAERSIRRNTDLWSFGVLAFRVLTGALPFSTGSFSPTSEQGRSELMRQINAGCLPSSVTTIAAPWRNVVEACLVVDNKSRIQSAEECISLLSNVAPADATRVEDNYGATSVDNVRSDDAEATRVDDGADRNAQHSSEREENISNRESDVAHEPSNHNEPRRDDNAAAQNDRPAATPKNETHNATRIIYSLIAIIMLMIIIYDYAEAMVGEYGLTFYDIAYALTFDIGMVCIWVLAAYLSIFVKKAPTYAHFTAFFAGALLCLGRGFIGIISIGGMIYAALALIVGWNKRRDSKTNTTM